MTATAPTAASERGDAMASEASRRVMAVIPAHDEATRIGPVVAGVLAHLPALVVDDGSDDATAMVAADAGAEVLIRQPNRGKGVALRTGFRAALDRGYGAVVTLDGDGQHDPADIPRFLEAYDRTPVDLIVGRRDFGSMPPIRRLANTLGRLMLSWAVGRSIPDNQCGFRLVGRRLIEALEGSDEPGFEFEVEMIATCLARRWPIAWVPVRTIYAGETSHIRPWRHVTSFIRITIAARRAARGGRDA